MKNTSFLKKLLTRIVLADILTIVPVRGYSSAGRALDWQSRGQRFDPAYLHHGHTEYYFLLTSTWEWVFFMPQSKLCLIPY